MTRPRDYIRYQEQRAKVRARHWIANHWWHGEQYTDDERLVGIHANTPKRCSCWICGNRRKVNGPTRQEQEPWE